MSYLECFSRMEQTRGVYMKELLEKNIHEVIERWPAVQEILSRFEIGCVTCNLGTCKLRDVVEIHNLDPAQERVLFGEIAALVFPGQTVESPVLERKPVRAGAGQSLSPPVRALVEEHVYIKRVIAALPALCREFVPGNELSTSRLQQAIAFVQGYADKFHHAKEEDILFGLFETDSDVVATMRAEHETGRAHIRQAKLALEQGKRDDLTVQLTAWAELLLEHIRKEDEILFPWMDRQLSDRQIGELFSACLEAEQCFGTAPKEFEAFSMSLM